MKPRVAFVVQRYGLEVNGGAEFHCRSIAELMSDVWNVTVFTTRALDYYTWKNYYPEGEDVINGVTVQRFSIKQPRNIKKFNRLSKKIYGRPHSLEDELNWMRAQGPDAPDLVEKIEADKDRFNAFIFFTYLYGTTYWSLPEVSHKSLLVPTAHDEPPIYLSLFNELFSKPRGFIFNSPEEKVFLKKKFDIDTSLSDVIGVGIRIDPTIGSNSFYADNLLDNYAIYVGRIEESKGCPQLFEFWERYKAKSDSELQLALVGRPQMKIPRRKDVVSLGFVSEEEKFAAISGAQCLIMPSPFESLSIVLLEAWICGRPVLVNGKCDVLKGQCRRSNGGLWYESYDEFEGCLNFLLTENEIAQKMAANGKRFVDSHYSLDQIKAKYIRLIDRFLNN
jgi:glycosyltransferase involved in cell wall biosynthesis